MKKKPDITQEEITTLMKERGLTVGKIIDAIVDYNGIIGVGLITLGDNLQKYVHNHRTERITKPYKS